MQSIFDRRKIYFSEQNVSVDEIETFNPKKGLI